MDAASINSGATKRHRLGDKFGDKFKGDRHGQAGVRHLWSKLKDPRAYASVENLRSHFVSSSSDTASMRAPSVLRRKRQAQSPRPSQDHTDALGNGELTPPGPVATPTLTSTPSQYVLTLDMDGTDDVAPALELPSPGESMDSDGTVFSSSSLMPRVSDLSLYDRDKTPVPEPGGLRRSPGQAFLASQQQQQQPTPEASPENDMRPTAGLCISTEAETTPVRNQNHDPLDGMYTPPETPDDELAVVPEEAAAFAHLISRGHGPKPSLSRFRVDRRQPSVDLPAKNPLRFSRVFSSDMALSANEYAIDNPYLTSPLYEYSQVGIPAKNPRRFYEPHTPLNINRNSRQRELLDWQRTLDEQFGLLDENDDDDNTTRVDANDHHNESWLLPERSKSMHNLRGGGISSGSALRGPALSRVAAPNVKSSGSSSSGSSSSSSSAYHDALDTDDTAVDDGPHPRSRSSSCYDASDHIRFNSISTMSSSENNTTAAPSKIGSRERNVNGCTIVESANSNTLPLPMERRRKNANESVFSLMRSFTTSRHKRVAAV